MHPPPPDNSGPKSHAFPTQTELFTPLLECLQEHGGEATTQQVYDHLADRFDLSEEARTRRVPATRSGGTTVNAWGRHVRWVRQSTQLQGLTETPTSGVWKLSGPGKTLLRNARPGICITVFTTPHGTMLWADARTAAGVVENGLYDLLFTSLPYPLLRRKDYESQHPVETHLDWAIRLLETWLPKLASHGVLALNVGDVYLRGLPAQSGWTERLLLRLMDDLGLHKMTPIYWQNPSKLPAPAEWVTIRRQVIKDEIEPCWILATDPLHTHLSNRRVLKPYSARMRRQLAQENPGIQHRPSGHVLGPDAFSRDSGGAIPGNLLRSANTSSQDRYQQRCREVGIPAHSARFPEELANFVIRYTTEPGDAMIEICSGSGTACEQAEILQRNWTGIDLSLTHLHGSAFRFEHRAGFRSYFPPDIERTLQVRAPDLFHPQNPAES